MPAWHPPVTDSPRRRTSCRRCGEFIRSVARAALPSGCSARRRAMALGFGEDAGGIYAVRGHAGPIGFGRVGRVQPSSRAHQLATSGRRQGAVHGTDPAAPPPGNQDRPVAPHDSGWTEFAAWQGTPHENPPAPGVRGWRIRIGDRRAGRRRVRRNRAGRGGRPGPARAAARGRCPPAPARAAPSRP